MGGVVLKWRLLEQRIVCCATGAEAGFESNYLILAVDGSSRE